MSTDEEASAAIKGVNNMRMPGSNVLLRARLAFKTVRRDGGDMDDPDFLDPDSHDDLDFRQRWWLAPNFKYQILESHNSLECQIYIGWPC